MCVYACEHSVDKRLGRCYGVCVCVCVRVCGCGLTEWMPLTSYLRGEFIRGYAIKRVHNYLIFELSYCFGGCISKYTLRC